MIHNALDAVVLSCDLETFSAHLNGSLCDSDEAMRCYQESLTRHEETGNQWTMAMVLNNLGMEYARLNDYEQAYGCLERSLTIRETVGDQWGLAGCYNNMGLVATWQENIERATHFSNEAIAIYRAIGAISKPSMATNMPFKP